LLRAFACDLHTHRRSHQVFLVVGVCFGLLELNSFLFRFALSVVHILSLLGKNFFGLRLHQLFWEMNVADEYVYHVHMIFQ